MSPERPQAGTLWTGRTLADHLPPGDNARTMSEENVSRRASRQMRGKAVGLAALAVLLGTVARRSVGIAIISG